MHNIDYIVSLKLNVQSDLMFIAHFCYFHTMWFLCHLFLANLDANMKNTQKIHAVVKALPPLISSLCPCYSKRQTLNKKTNI